MQIITIVFSALLFFTGIFALVIFAIALRNMWNRAVHPWKGLSIMLVGVALFLTSLITAAVATNKLSQNLKSMEGGEIFNLSSSKSSVSGGAVQSSISSRSVNNRDNLYGN